MQTKTFLLSAILITIVQLQLVAQTHVSGDQSGTWTAAKSPYVIDATVTVPQGKTLKISAGVEVQFPATNNTSQLIVQGTLKAIGASSDYIKFTGGGVGYPQARGPVRIEATSTNSVLQYVTIDALGYYYNSDYTAAVIVRSSSCLIKNCNIQNTRGTGLQFDNASPQVANNSFTANSNLDVILPVDNVVQLTGNNALKVGLTTSTITKNDELAIGNVYYKLLDNLTVPQGKTLTVAAGVEVQFPATSSTSQLIVQGNLKAIGTKAKLIKFTGGGVGYPQLRGPVTIEATSTNSVLQYVTIDGLGYYYNSDYTAAIIVRASTCTIQNCNIQNTRGTGIEMDNAAPQISNNIFTGNSNMDVILGIDNLIKLTGNNALKVGLATTTITKNDELVTGNIYYKLLDNLTVPQGKTLTIAAGVEVQFPATSSTSQLIVQGNLKAIGTKTKLIKFTGGGVGYPQLRGPVTIEATSANSVLQYVTIDGLGYYYNSDYTAAVIVRASSCTIKNCNIQNTRGTGIKLDNAAPDISNNIFTGNSNMDVILGIDNMSALTGNNPLMIGLTSSTMAKNDNLPAGNVYYRLLDNLTVPQGKTLTIAAGAEVQFPATNGSQLIIQGILKAIGTNSKFIKFAGGGVGYPQTRGPVTVEATSVNSVLQYVSIESLGYYYNSITTGILVIRSSSCTVKNCSFLSNRGSSIIIDNASPAITNNVFSGTANADIYGDALSFDNTSNNNSAKVYVSASVVNKNATWPLQGSDGSKYILSGTISVNQNFSLTIAAGATVDFNNNNGNISVDGSLKAIGTNAAKVLFVKQATDASWGGTVSFSGSSKNSKLSYVSIDKLGSITSPAKGAAIDLSTNSISIDNVSISNSQNIGLNINDKDPLLVQCSFLNNKDAVVSTGGKATFVQCLFQANTGYGIRNLSSIASDKIDARYCWWGTAKGPSIVTNPGGNGDSITAKVLYIPFQNVKNNLKLPGIDSVKLSDSSACPGTTILVSSKVTGVFENGNVFTAQLSDASGNFTNPVAIGTYTAGITGNLVTVGINALLPGSVKANGYKIRIVSSTPAAVSESKSIIPKNCGAIASAEEPAAAISAKTSFSITAYPNPTSNLSVLNINGANEKTVVLLSDMNGRILWQQTGIIKNQLVLPTNKLATGMYLVTVYCGRASKTLKLIKQ